MIQYSCGCANERHEPTGALRNVSKCRRHQRAAREPETLDEGYYAEFGLIKNGKLQPSNHVAELTEALGPIPWPTGNTQALEIGCGVSPYAGPLIERGWHYIGVEPSLWVADWMYRTYGVDIIQARLENVVPSDVHLLGTRFGLILAAHSIEHMQDAPGAIARCAELLAPGGWLYIVIPNDDDPVNADHLWFFDQESLRHTVEAAGLTVEAMAIRQYIPREHFIYCRASKP